MLSRIGVPTSAKRQVAADAGYCAQADLAFAARVRERIDILIEGTTDPESRTKFFGREKFKILDDSTAICPAGRPMKGPARHSDGRTMWHGIGCVDCPMRSGCTDGKQRTLTANLELDRLRALMQQRMSAPDGKSRYNRRIATVEPVFSNIESTMGYRRGSSRHEPTILAEVLLKVLAHNVSRLLAAKRLSCVYFLVLPDSSLLPLESEFPAAV